MLELLIGAILGAIGSLVVTHYYYKISSRDLDKSISELKNEISQLKEITEFLSSTSNIIYEDTSTIRKHVSLGTSDDPDFPYK